MSDTDSKPSSGTRSGPSGAARFAGIVLVAAAVIAVVAGLVREFRRGETGPPPAGVVAEADAVTVFYFHATQRCATCLAIERETARVLHEHFADALAQGRLRFRSLDFDLPENLHYRDEFQLAFGSVVVQGAGPEAPWRNLSEVWSLVRGEPELFATYLVTHIRPLLGAPE